jgi:hypothetical protein
MGSNACAVERVLDGDVDAEIEKEVVVYGMCRTIKQGVPSQAGDRVEWGRAMASH